MSTDPKKAKKAHEQTDAEALDRLFPKAVHEHVRKHAEKPKKPAKKRHLPKG